MAISTQTVVINVVVRGGNNAQLLNALGGQAQQTATKMNFLQKAAHSLGTQFTVLSKALVSMIGVLVAFNLFVTLPERIARGLIAIVASAIKTADEVQRTVLSISGLMLSFVSYGKTVDDSFEGAYQVSKRLTIQFSQLAAASLASAEDLVKGFQAFISRGGMALVKTMDDAAIATQRLVDLTLVLTGGQAKEKQIMTEIPALLEGQVRSGAILARLIRSQVGDLDAWLARLRQSKDLVAEIDRLFPGIAKASKELANTFTGIVNSIAGSAKMLNTMAMGAGGFKPLLDILKSIRDALQQTMKELLQGPEKMSPQSKSILSMFVGFSAAIATLTESVRIFLLEVSNSSTILETIEKIAFRVNMTLITVGSTMEWLSGVFAAYRRGMTLGPGVAIVSSWMAAADLGKIAQKNVIAYLATMVDIRRKLFEELGKPLPKGTFFDQLTNEEDLAKQKQALDRAYELLQKIRFELRLAEAGDDEILKIDIKLNESLRERGEILKVNNAYLDEGVWKMVRIADLEKAAVQRKAFDLVQEGVWKLYMEGIKEATLAGVEHIKFVIDLNEEFAHAADTGFRRMIDGVRNIIDEQAILITQTSELSNRLMYVASHSGDVATAYKDVADSIQQMQSTFDTLSYTILALRQQLEFTLGVEEQGAILDQIRQLESVVKRTKGEIDNAKDIITDLQALAQAMVTSIQHSFNQFVLGVGSTLTLLKDLVQDVLMWIGSSMGQLLTDIFVAAFSGESVVKALKRFLGQMLISLGQWAVASGTITLLGGILGLWTPHVGRSLALIAAGTAAIALGAKMSSSGGAKEGTTAGTSSSTSPEPIYIAQQKIAAQQGIQHALVQNTIAISNLNNEVARLSKETGDTLVQKAVKKNPSIVVKPVVSAATNSFTVQRALGGALSGVNS